MNLASKMMPVIALSVTEAELYAAIQCVMKMLFVMRVLLSIGLQVALPMILEVDNKGDVDIYVIIGPWGFVRGILRLNSTFYGN